jgi:predicted AlkP superfamily phosphohydrolase/phosphomutase
MDQSRTGTSPTEAKKGKVVILGLDGADFDLLQPLIDSGDLPNLQRFQGQGAWGRLASTIPPISVPAWPSCFTGVNPGKHGVFGFGKFDPLSYQDVLCQSTDVQAPALWHLLGEAGQRSLVINVPLTFPPQPLEGVLISGMFPSPHANYIYPLALQEEIHRQVGVVMREPSIRTLRRASPAQQLELLKEVVDQQQRLLFYLEPIRKPRLPGR